MLRLLISVSGEKVESRISAEGSWKEFGIRCGRFIMSMVSSCGLKRIGSSEQVIYDLLTPRSSSPG